MIQSGQYFETDRLILRLWKDEDLPIFARMNACRHVCRFLPGPLSEAASNALAERIMAHFAEHGFGLYAVERKDTREFVGFTGLTVPGFRAHFMPAVEIGWRLSRANWGQGMATEAAVCVRDYAFGELRLEEIVSFTATHNGASRRVMEKIGMSHNSEEDFDHPALDEGHPFRRHVLYRLKKT